MCVRQYWCSRVAPSRLTYLPMLIMYLTLQGAIWTDVDNYVFPGLLHYYRYLVATVSPLRATIVILICFISSENHSYSK